MEKLIKTIVIFGFLAVIYSVLLACNDRDTGYETFNQTDRVILSELDEYFKADAECPIWPDYDLASKTIAAVNGRWGMAYLVNPAKEPHGLFASEVELPKDYDVQVYRVSAFAPQMLAFRGLESFNTEGKRYELFGNEVYFTRYDDSAVNQKYDAGHYITFLTHEAFHHYMQENWGGESRLNTDVLTKQDLDLLDEQFQILTKIQDELLTGAPQREKLLAWTREYLDVMEKRKAANPDYVRDELMGETVEGTATYVGIRASKAVGYDFEVMHIYRDYLAVLKFDELVPGIRSGAMPQSALTTNIIYESGALLCELLDALEVPDWKQQLNAQTLEYPVSLHSILERYMESLPQGR